MSRAVQLEAFLERMPFARLLGIRCDIRGDEMTAVLPFQQKFVGNAAIGALHGGCTGAFLEVTAMAQLYLSADVEHPPRPVGITVDYLRSARTTDLYARAIVQKLGRRMASVRAEAWQDRRDAPVLALYGHFLVSSDK